MKTTATPAEKVAMDDTTDRIDGVPDAQPAAQAPDPKTVGDGAVRLSQAELDRMFVERARRGKEVALREASEKLGCPVEEAAAQLEEYRQLKAAQQTDAEKLQASLEAASKRAEAAEQALSALNLQASYSEALARAGCNPEMVKVAIRLTDGLSGNLEAEQLDALAASVVEANEFLRPKEQPRRASTTRGAEGRGEGSASEALDVNAILDRLGVRTF